VLTIEVGENDIKYGVRNQYDNPLSRATRKWFKQNHKMLSDVEIEDGVLAVSIPSENCSATYSLSKNAQKFLSNFFVNRKNVSPQRVSFHLIKRYPW
jgi:hypothetical protein